MKQTNKTLLEISIIIAELLSKDTVGKYDFEIKDSKEKKPRSLDANAYLWTLCRKLAEKIGKQTKEDIYYEAIRKVGQFETLPIKNEALEKFIASWNTKGLGWLCESLGTSKLEGYTNVLAYYGSSVYDTKEMSILVDYIVEECKSNGVETMTERELSLLKEDWQ